MELLQNILFLLCCPVLVDSSKQGELVGKWADKLGRDLNELGKIITKNEEIKQRYTNFNAQVVKKNARNLLSEIIENVHGMFQRKMDAIGCIYEKAEQAANDFDKNITMDEYNYTSSKYSQADVSEMYQTMNLNSDTHFYNILVDTNKSSVHVPMNIFDRHIEPKIAIQWSEELDDIFKNNYESDPSLSWQYFCSSTGIMRHYPAKEWIYDENTDVFDCRIRTWYIEAATCTKDVVILLDNSGSMEGMNGHIASLTVYSILDTFSNNDYINVLNYSQSFNYTVPCFEGLLMKATSENIEKFKEAVGLLQPNGKTNIEDALIESLQLLKRYREKRNCKEVNPCNQAIMIITDGVTKNYTNLLLKHNRFENGTRSPVRIFTYLIGTEATAEKEISEIACKNRGFYSHIDTLEQVTSSVYEYIMVIARPLVLQALDHPISWTHAYADPASVENGHIRLLTSAAVPTYDNNTDPPELLGVAGTDVPIEDIQKLTYPHKIGVNAHVFIISNNGYIIVHPGWRPIFWEKKLKTNYNSVDLTEVLQLDDGNGPRVIRDEILELRRLLIEGTATEKLNVSLKYHYNDMQRVAREQFDFYWENLPDTPFTISVAISKQFGYYSVQVPDEIIRNRHMQKPIKDFFIGTNWKIHPRWVYCKYHYLEGHEYNSPEDELLHFLERMYDRGFKWAKQYKEMDQTKSCKKQTLGHDDYFCDKDLINMLIFDAKITTHAFREPWTFKNDRESNLFKRYNTTLRFMATMSGLTRWEYVFGEGNETIKEFGDIHAAAQDETWYKSAVLQHQYDPESFVYSVPVDPVEEAIPEMSVTGSYAIFAKDAGMEAPASVVGFQFSLHALNSNFFEITSSKYKCADCNICDINLGELDCYVIDHSGYILTSTNLSDTGKFFGRIHKAVMEKMLDEGIYDQVTLYDYQGVCIQNSSSGPVAVSERKENRDESEGQLYFPCDQYKTLFILNQTRFIQGISYDTLQTKCSDTFYIKRIQMSNLLLVAVKKGRGADDNENCKEIPNYTNFAKEIVYENNTLHICQKKNLNELVRRPLEGCFYYHPNEELIKACGSGNKIKISISLCFIAQVLMLIFS